MKIAIVTLWYNEEDLAPFFLKHYSYVDRIFLFLDADTTDNTRKICESYSNVKIENFSFPEGFDCITQVEKINQVVKELKGQFDWVYSVDADEFIFPPKEYKDAKEFLAKQETEQFNLVRAKMWQVFPHYTDPDLDPTNPVIKQRQHGDPDLNSQFNLHYANKPIVVKPETDIIWHPGCHSFRSSKIKVAEKVFYGVHWKMASEQIAIKRRIEGRRLRLSKRQIKRCMSWQDWNVSKETILADLEKHKNDPNVLGDLLPKEGVN